ncbi:MAG TPA: hypothetical protein DDW58_09305, partial [Clostridiaceae bacterium]|nr:hypothetical protein [Clostridiaceae bacterium]
MLKQTEMELKNYFNIDDKILELSQEALNDIKPELDEVDKIKEYNQMKVLKAMQEERLSDSHFTNSTGYGYGDIGRDTLERVYARIFNAEDAIVRPHIVSGTHAIAIA